MNVKVLALNYFKAFEEKDIDKLKQLYDDGIRLVDWTIDVETKPFVLEENKKIFQTFPTLKIQVVEIAENQNTVIAHILIDLDDNNQIKVCDLLKFNDQGFITLISAFKQ